MLSMTQEDIKSAMDEGVLVEVTHGKEKLNP